MRGVLNAISILLLTAIAGSIGITYCDSCRGAAFFAVGRANGCSLKSAVRAMNFESDTQDIQKQLRQIRSMDGLELWASPQGEFWIPSGEQGGVISSVLAELKDGAYGFADDIRPGAVVLDCGAHIGMFTRHALRSGAEKVIAIEPSPRNIACLRLNFAKEIEAGRVVVYPKGVWDSETTLVFHADDGNSARGSFLDRDILVKPRTIEVPVTTVDRLVDELQLNRVDFVKMDIEGSEPRAIRGATATIKRHRPTIAAAVYHSVGDAEAVRSGVLAAVPDYQIKPASCGNTGTTVIPTTVLISVSR